MRVITDVNKLNLFDQVLNSFKENPLVSLMPFFIGIVFGFLLCLLIYVFILINSLKKTEKLASNVVLEVDDEIINNQIENARNAYIEESSYKATNQKMICLRDTCWDLMNDIAKTYYPESKYPLYELSIDELILLSNYITNRVDNLFSGAVLKKIKNIKISSILKIVDLKKKYDQNKVVKAANKVHLPKGLKIAFTVLNSLNPVYWVKKVMIDGTFNVIVNKIALTIIEVVGEETSNVYSKNAFRKNNDEEIIKEINEIEGLLEGEYNEK